MINKEDIVQYYQEKIETNSSEDFLRQVGKTSHGEVISVQQFNCIIESISSNLNLLKTDKVIDLGCANGLVTYQVSNYCESIAGFDLSKNLIDTAKKYHKKKNITYHTSNILDIDFLKLNSRKIYMYEVLQHFDFSMLRKLLKKINDALEIYTLFIASIPDREKIFNFYDDDRKLKYFFFNLLEQNQSHIGNWWYRKHIELLCEDLSLSCKIFDQNNQLPTSKYRFDVIISR